MDIEKIVKDLGAKARRLQAAMEKEDLERASLHACVVEATRQGVPQHIIAAESGYNRERVRQICRAAGVPPRS
jgi:hypothetical protein